MNKRIFVEKTVDLHVHTCFSDGAFSPKEVVEYAKKTGLSCIAIADHDCIDGIAPARRAAKKLDLEIVPAVEMTAREKNIEIHILGFYPDIKDKDFLGKLEVIRRSRIDRMDKIIEKLKKYNVIIDPEEVLKISGPGSVGRLHLAAVLEDKGYVSSVREAFGRFLGDKGPCYVRHLEMSAKDTILELKRVGAVAVFAHPNLMGGESLIPKLVGYGLDGIEAYHSEHSPSAARRYVELAGEYHLLVTGGSDCHGLNKGRILMGTVRVPYGFVEELRRCAAKISNT